MRRRQSPSERQPRALDWTSSSSATTRPQPVSTSKCRTPQRPISECSSRRRATTLKKGSGTILRKRQLNHGAAVRAHLVASGVPLSKKQRSETSADSSMRKRRSGGDQRTLEHARRRREHSHRSDSDWTRHAARPPMSECTSSPSARPPHTIGKTKCGKPWSAHSSGRIPGRSSQGAFHQSVNCSAVRYRSPILEVTDKRTSPCAVNIAIHGLDLGAIGERSPPFRIGWAPRRAAQRYGRDQELLDGLARSRRGRREAHGTRESDERESISKLQKVGVALRRKGEARGFRTLSIEVKTRPENGRVRRCRRHRRARA